MRHARLLLALGSAVVMAFAAQSQETSAGSLTQTPGPSAHSPVQSADVRNARYCELFVVRGRLLDAEAQVYNTLGLNDCPGTLWNALDLDAVRAQLQATDVIRNGPRYFVMDRITLANPLGTVTFGDLAMNRVATFALSPGDLISARRGGQHTPYSERTIQRSTQYVFSPGRLVYQLVSPENRVYVMQSYAHIVDDTLTEQALSTLGARLQLPEGWQYRVQALDSQLVVGTPGGEAHIVQDELENTYQRLDN